LQAVDISVTDEQHRHAAGAAAATPKHDRLVEELVQRVADLAGLLGITLAAAESLTSGQLTAALGSGAAASDWFRGAVIAYAPVVKFNLLGVPEGPVVTLECARAMASGVRRVLQADAAIALTGVGGPGEIEGQPAGTVHLATDACGQVRHRTVQLDGDPEAVMGEAVHAALEFYVESLELLSGS
jgi:nicotinamide-nucleotide amidase